MNQLKFSQFSDQHNLQTEWLAEWSVTRNIHKKSFKMGFFKICNPQTDQIGNKPVCMLSSCELTSPQVDWLWLHTGFSANHMVTSCRALTLLMKLATFMTTILKRNQTLHWQINLRTVSCRLDSLPTTQLTVMFWQKIWSTKLLWVYFFRLMLVTWLVHTKCLVHESTNLQLVWLGAGLSVNCPMSF